MSISREQVMEIMGAIDVVGLSEYQRSLLKTALESMVEKEYKCPICGTRLEKRGNVMPLYQCLGCNEIVNIKQFCFSDDWNGGIL